MAFSFETQSRKTSNEPTSPQISQSTTIIRLVNGENTSRPFLRILEEQHITLNNFDSLISPNPFKKYRSVTKSFDSKSNSSMSPILLSCGTNAGLGSCFNLYARKANSEVTSPVRILKQGPRSRFASKKNCSFTDMRRVQIIAD